MGASASKKYESPPKPSEGYESVRVIDSKRYLEYLRDVKKEDPMELFLWERKIPFGINYQFCLASSIKEELGRMYTAERNWYVTSRTLKVLCFELWGASLNHCIILNADDAGKIKELMTKIHGA